MIVEIVQKIGPHKCKTHFSYCRNRKLHTHTHTQTLTLNSLNKRQIVIIIILHIPLGFNFIPILLLEPHFRRSVKEIDCLLANIKISFKYMGKEIFSKLFIACLKLELEYTSHI